MSIPWPGFFRIQGMIIFATNTNYVPAEMEGDEMAGILPDRGKVN